MGTNVKKGFGDNFEFCGDGSGPKSKYKNNLGYERYLKPHVN